jgi:hypothetical protein
MENHGHGQDGRFDFERLVVHQKAMEFLELIAGLINNPPRKAASVIDHLDREACSTILNIAEGSGKERDSRTGSLRLGQATLLPHRVPVAGRRCPSMSPGSLDSWKLQPDFDGDRENTDC